MTMEKYSKCRMNAAQAQGSADMDMMIKMFNSEIKRTRNIERLRGKLCRKAARLYVPNGLMDQIPEEWRCEWDELKTVPSGDMSKTGEDGYSTELLKIYEANLQKDKKTFDKLFKKAMEIQEMVNSKTDIDFSECETIRSESVQNNCPVWNVWSEWTECPECRGTKGAFRSRFRDCMGMSKPTVGQSMPYTVVDCEDEYGQKSTEDEPCDIDECPVCWPAC